MKGQVFQEDLEYILQSQCISWNALKYASVLVTGATGLIGSTLVKALAYANTQLSLEMSVYCLVRDSKKAHDLFSDLEKSGCLHFIEGSLENMQLPEEHMDHIIHCASPTASGYFISNPVEVIENVVGGTVKLLKRAVADHTKSFLYLSSMEAYGHVLDERELTEDQLGEIDLSNIRNCYPETKRLCELLCKSYVSEYGLKTVSLRLAQTFGPGIDVNDNRVFAMMARCAMNHEDIVLHTKGTSKHPYLYSAQAITAILCALINGAAGETYNACNPATYCSIFEMGEIVANSIADGAIRVRTEENGNAQKYPLDSCLNLNIDKIKSLGWAPEGTLVEMYERMIASM